MHDLLYIVYGNRQVTYTYVGIYSFKKLTHMITKAYMLRTLRVFVGHTEILKGAWVRTKGEGEG